MLASGVRYCYISPFKTDPFTPNYISKKPTTFPSHHHLSTPSGLANLHLHPPHIPLHPIFRPEISTFSLNTSPSSQTFHLQKKSPKPPSLLRPHRLQPHPQRQQQRQQLSFVQPKSPTPAPPPPKTFNPHRPPPIIHHRLSLPLETGASGDPYAYIHHSGPMDMYAGRFLTPAIDGE